MQGLRSRLLVCVCQVTIRAILGAPSFLINYMAFNQEFQKDDMICFEQCSNVHYDALFPLAAVGHHLN